MKAKKVIAQFWIERTNPGNSYMLSILDTKELLHNGDPLQEDEALDGINVEELLKPKEPRFYLTYGINTVELYDKENELETKSFPFKERYYVSHLVKLLNDR